ncbi:MAG: phospholipid carrier-dependent glycosyltransferase [Deltaproteobacteria bacterium]
MKLRLVLLALLTLVAGWERCQNISFGLPDHFRPDEEYLVSRAVGFQEDFNPHFAVYPALQMYVQHAALRAGSWWRGETGDFRIYLRENNYAPAHLSGRAVSVGFGTLTVPALYWAAMPAFGPVAALTSAAALTFATIHVRESKYATTDAAGTFWLTLAMGAMLRILRDGRIRWSILGGVLTGLAIATKYPTGAILAGLAVAHIGARWREGRTLWRVVRDLRPWLTLYFAVFTAVLATPWIFLDWQQTMKDFTYQRGFVERGVGNPFGGWGWDWFLGKVMPDSFGPELAIALGLALVWVVLRPRLGTLSLLTFVVIALIGITSSRYAFYRYVMVPLPALLLFLGIAVADLRTLAARFVPGRLATAGTALLVALLLVPCVIRDYKLNRLLGRRDSRTMARQWIEENVPRGARIATTLPRTPYGKPQLGGRNVWVALDDAAALRERGVHWVLSDSDMLPFYSPGFSTEELRALARDAELRFEVNPLKPDTPAPIFDQGDAFYVPLRHASSVKRPGPRIRIWKLADVAGGR